MPKPSDHLKKVDRPEVSEIFADIVGASFFDGNVLRLQFNIARYDDPSTGKDKKPSGKIHPACRLVLPANCVPDLYHRLQQIVSLMEQKGILRRIQEEPENIQ